MKVVGEEGCVKKVKKVGGESREGDQRGRGGGL